MSEPHAPTWKAKWGFLLTPPRPARLFSLRTTATALAAFLAAFAMGLPSPHWAAMTVWVLAPHPPRFVVAFDKALPSP
ncbi:FUSC family protein [Myxococcus sp. Y35]|uniref:FUSC family protein n=1 Tax=Pseudomyxococcus flavus TaxID=3115648 RepID=UPI003CF9C822